MSVSLHLFHSLYPDYFLYFLVYVSTLRIFFHFICVRAAIICTAGAYISNGYIEGDTTVTVNSSVVYKCDAGFDLHGDNNRTCTENSSFSTPEPVCRPVECPVLPKLSNGSTIGSDHTFNNSVTFSCDRRFRLEGNSSITCQASGNWSADVPICEGW